MPLLQTRGTGSSKGLGFTASAAPTYIEDVFSTYLYSGTGATQTITNGIDLAGKGGLVWTKARSAADGSVLIDSAQGDTRYLTSYYTNAAAYSDGTTQNITNFNSNGYALGTNESGATTLNTNAVTYVSWTFRKQPKFFDVVTYTGNGTGSQVVSHNLESVPGCVIIKRTDAASDWPVYHRGNEFAPAEALALNLTSGTSSTYRSLNGVPTSTTFTVGSGVNPVNISGGTYVAYLFAHNAGGFGLTGTDNVISCGEVGTYGNTVNLGWEPQWILLKRVDSTSAWYIFDTMRGLTYTFNGATYLSANTVGAETTAGTIDPITNGFVKNASGSYIYIAIRRGPMKVPTVGTSVFAVDTEGQFSPKPPGHTSGFVTDMALVRNVTTTNSMIAASRLTGDKYLVTSSTAAEGSLASIDFDYMNGWLNISTTNPQYYSWMFRRAPGFFDVVCYTGDETEPRSITHKLNVAPELLIVKSRSAAVDWTVGCTQATAGGSYSYNIPVLFLNTTAAQGDYGNFQNKVNQTSSVFTVRAGALTNGSGSTYVAYLFATCAGVSKVGSYTGTGTKTYTVINSGSGAYLIDSVSNPNITLQRGVTYTFNVTASGHPFWIKTAAVTGTGSSYNDGVTNNGIDSGTVTFTVPLNAPDTLYYICQYHGSMVGTLNIISKQINCGFTSGARFVMIKRTDSTGNWYIWDTVRGIIAGNDPYLLLNSVAAEVTNTDYIDPYSAGFEISSTAPAEINANGGTYIFLAIA